MKKNEIKINLIIGDSRRITKSKGAVQVSSIEGIECEELTFIPREPWSKISIKEFFELSTTNSNYCDITLIKLPKKIKNQFKKIDICECVSYNDINFIQRTREYRSVLISLTEYLIKHNLDNTEIIKHAIHLGKPGLKNVTFNSKENVYIGMHLDSWESNDLSSRDFSRNRICINLGKQSRYLLYYNISIVTMAIMIDYDIKNINFDINYIYKSFAMAYPDWPIYKIEIQPYEAYIAPTEFMIHDGSTWGTTHPDISLVFRGKFLFKNNAILKKLFLNIKNNIIFKKII